MNTRSSSIPTLSLLQLLLLLLVAVQPVTIRAEDVGDQSHQQIKVSKGAVAADNGVCSEAGRDVMKSGGNAIDAAVTTALCQGVVGQGCSGLGGGSFIVIRLANGISTTFVMREQAPSAATPHMFDDHPERKENEGLSVGVPGELAGLHAAWTKYKSGKLSWSSLFQPAIKLAGEGFAVSPYLHYQFLINPHAMFNHTGLCQVYTKLNKQQCDELNGKPVDDSYFKYLLQPGDIARNPMLAKTLTLIANHGPSVFYNGPIGAQLVHDIQKAGGVITLDDFREYKVIEREPLRATVLQGVQENLEVISMASPSSGGACFILLLNIVKHLGVPENLEDVDGRHLYVEALKHVFGIRENLGDWDFHPDVKEVIAEMLDDKFAKAIARNISNNHGKTYARARSYGASWAPIPDDGTSHFSIIDADRNAVAMTTSLNYHFGSLILSPSTGIVLNNVMDDFSAYGDPTGLPPAPSNIIQPKQRPLSSMNPTIIVQNGQLKGVIGASGGPLIIPATTRVFLNHFGMGMQSPLDCVSFPRVYHKLYPNVVYYENMTTFLNTLIEVPDSVLEYLRSKGHKLEAWFGENSQCQFVVEADDKESENGISIFAVSDPRKGGFPAGYN